MSAFVIITCYFIIAILIGLALICVVYGSVLPKDIDLNDEYFDIICGISALWPMSIIAGFIVTPIFVISYAITSIKKLIIKRKK